MPFVAGGRLGSDSGIEVGLGTEDDVTMDEEGEGGTDVVAEAVADVVAMGIVEVAEIVAVTKMVDCALGDEGVVSGAGKRCIIRPLLSTSSFSLRNSVGILTRRKGMTAAFMSDTNVRKQKIKIWQCISVRQ